MHMAERAAQIGTSVRDADRALLLNGGGNGLLDATHFDTVRFPPPEWATQVMAEAIADGSTAYTAYRGNADVLAGLAHSVGEFLGVPLTSDNLAITPGTQGGLFTTLSAIIDPGDLVMLADPEYLFSERMLAFLGARVERIPVHFDNESPTLDLDSIGRLATQGPKLLMLSHPSNPTGAVYSPEHIAQLAQAAVTGDFRLLVDELYSRLVYDETPFRHVVAEPEMASRCITMLGPSKTESMSGFRLGVVVGPTDVIEAVEQTLAVTSLRAPAYSQQLLRRWLVDDSQFIAQRVADLHALRAMTVDALRGVPGLRVGEPRGTAYVFPDVRDLGVSDQNLAAALRRDAGVIASPGYQFGPRGVGHFRLCYARDEVEWEAALDRIVKVLTAF
jgi:aspartate/methionine/tyrosine aminotransferase